MTHNTMTAHLFGLYVNWDPKPCPHAIMLAALESIGVGDLCKPPYSVGESLNRAMQSYARRHRKTLLADFENKSKTSLKTIRLQNANIDGYELVAIQHGKSENDYPNVLAAKVDINGTELVDITRGRWRVDCLHELQQEYNTNRATISGSAMSQMLVETVQLLNGTCTRSVGGNYYLPSGSSNDWEELVQAIDSTGTTAIEVTRITEPTPSNLRAIFAGITHEMASKSESLLDKISRGELGKRALEHRETTLNQMRKKMREYENILESPLQNVRKALEKTETAIAMAKMAAVAAA